MYYVMQVAPGKEAETEKYILERIPDEYYSSCFYPVRYVRKKFHGKWYDRCEKLLPGYVFIKSENVYGLYLELKKVPMLTRLLGQDKEFVTALTGQETAWLEKIIPVVLEGTTKAEIPLSSVEVGKDDEIKILCGPLKNMAGMIKKINLHKRIAEIEVKFMGRTTTIHLGIEMIKKE